MPEKFKKNKDKGVKKASAVADKIKALREQRAETVKAASKDIT